MQNLLIFKNILSWNIVFHPLSLVLVVNRKSLVVNPNYWRVFLHFLKITFRCRASIISEIYKWYFVTWQRKNLIKIISVATLLANFAC